MKLTEDETIKFLLEYLKGAGWSIDGCCYGKNHGYDIEASKGAEKLVVEVKGARANPASTIKKRDKFDSGQIKTHFGKAIVKVLEDKVKNPTYRVAIAQPDDVDIRKAVGALVPSLLRFGISHFWVKSDGQVEDFWAN